MMSTLRKKASYILILNSLCNFWNRTSDMRKSRSRSASSISFISWSMSTANFLMIIISARAVIFFTFVFSCALLNESKIMFKIMFMIKLEIIKSWVEKFWLNWETIIDEKVKLFKICVEWADVTVSAESETDLLCASIYAVIFTAASDELKKWLSITLDHCRNRIIFTISTISKSWRMYMLLTKKCFFANIILT